MEQSCTNHQALPDADDFTLQATRRPIPSPLPSTSAAFQFFPAGDASSRTPRTLLSRYDSSSTIVVDEDLNGLRSNAFGELRRSIVEGGEGLVRRMQAWEDSRSTRHVPIRTRSSRGRGAKSSPPIYDTDPEDALMDDEDEDDIQIVSADASFNLCKHRLAPHKRISSLGVMDVDSSEADTPIRAPMSTESSEYCSSPITIYSSDDEEPAVLDFDVTSSRSGASHTPALSHTYTNSSNSSFVSLPLPPPAQSLDAQFPSSFAACTPINVPSFASRSEKAIAALALAMANGAGGLNDYTALRGTETNKSSDLCQVGELWH